MNPISLIQPMFGGAQRKEKAEQIRSSITVDLETIEQLPESVRISF